MNLATILNPDANTLATCRELGDETSPLLDGEVLMTVEQLNDWKQQPEQVAKLEAIRAAQDVADQTLVAKQTKISALVSAGFTQQQAEALIQSQQT